MGTTYASQVIDEQAKKPRSSFWKEMPILLAVAVIVAVLVRAFVLQTFFIPSESMEHTLNVNDRVLVNKLVYDFRDPHRGEIIVFKSPLDWRSDPTEDDFIKRVIGVGGDHVSCNARSHVVVNGKELDETSYLFVDPVTGRQAPACKPGWDVTIPAGRLWVMGDNREHSGDSAENFSRSHVILQATISVDAVVGRAFVLFWPLGSATWLSVPSTFDDIPSAPGQ